MHEFWKNYAATYGNALDLEEKIRRAAAFFIGRIAERGTATSPSRVVELGCGNGKILAKCAPYASAQAQIIGIDSSPDMLIVARQALNGQANIDLREEDIIGFARTSATASYDGVLSCNTLHNLPSEEAIAETIRSMARMLKPGGEIMFDIRNAGNPFISRGYARNRSQGLQFFTFSVRRAKHILRKQGLTEITVTPIRYQTLEEAGKQGQGLLGRLLYRCYLSLTRCSWWAPYVLIQAKKPSTFVSVVWGYHPQMFKLSAMENYHLEALNVACELGYEPEAYLIDARAKMEEDPNLVAALPVTYHRGFLSYARFLWERRGSFFYCNTFTILSFLPAWFTKRSIFMGHDSVRRKTRFKQWVQDILLRRFTRVRVISPEEKEFLVARGADPERVVVAPLAIDVDLFGSIRGENRSGLVFLGNVTPDKDGVTILKALSNVRKIIPGVTLDVIGEVRDPAFTATLKELGLESSVVLRGFIPHAELPKYLGRYIIYVNSSISEGQCLAAYEAALAGLAVCLPDTLSFRGVFDNAALFHKEGDAETLAANIARYLNDKDLRDRHARASREFISSTYNRAAVNTTVKRLFAL